MRSSRARPRRSPLTTPPTTTNSMPRSRASPSKPASEPPPTGTDVNTAYKPTADEIKRLREETGAGMSDVRNALLWAEGNQEKAKARLGELGQSKAEKKAAERTANEGLVGSYIHAGGKIGVLVEINCETDFVARNERFRELVRDVAMHIAAMSPQYLDREAVPADVLAEVKVELEKTVPPGKPANVVEKILEGKLHKWFEEHT